MKLLLMMFGAILCTEALTSSLQAPRPRRVVKQNPSRPAKLPRPPGNNRRTITALLEAEISFLESILKSQTQPRQKAPQRKRPAKRPAAYKPTTPRAPPLDPFYMLDPPDLSHKPEGYGAPEAPAYKAPEPPKKTASYQAPEPPKAAPAYEAPKTPAPAYKAPATTKPSYKIVYKAPSPKTPAPVRPTYGAYEVYKPATPSKPSYKPNRPRKPAYKPAKPTYKPTKPAYRPPAATRPAYKPKPTKPAYKPTQPPPTKPAYKPTQPPPTKPAYKPPATTQPAYQPPATTKTAYKPKPFVAFSSTPQSAPTYAAPSAAAPLPNYPPPPVYIPHQPTYAYNPHPHTFFASDTDTKSINQELQVNSVAAADETVESVVDLRSGDITEVAASEQSVQVHGHGETLDTLWYANLKDIEPVKSEEESTE